MTSCRWLGRLGELIRSALRFSSCCAAAAAAPSAPGDVPASRLTRLSAGSPAACTGLGSGSCLTSATDPCPVMPVHTDTAETQGTECDNV